MARRIVCGWETGSLFEASAISAATMGADCPAAAARTGNYGLRVVNQEEGSCGLHTISGYNSTNTCAASSLVEPTIYTQVHVLASGTPTGSAIFVRWLNTSAAVKATLRWETDNKLRLLDAGTKSLALSSAVATGQWVSLRTYFTTSAASAHWSFFVDGALVGSGEFANTTAVNHGTITFGWPSLTAAYGTFYFDDLIVDNATFPASASTRIGVLRPGSDSSTNTGFVTGAAGYPTKWGSLTQNPAGGGGYITSTTSNDIYTSPVDGLTSYFTAGDELGAVAILLANIRGAAGSTVGLALRSGGTPTNTLTATAAQQSSIRVFGAIYDTEPSASTAWTSSLIANAEVGLFRSTGTSRGDDAYLLFEYTEKFIPPGDSSSLYIGALLKTNYFYGTGVI